jgi:DNA-binding LacI/PurR family transcriptional regulator
MAKFASPPLTTIHLPAVEQGRLGTELLIKLIQGKKVSEQRTLLKDELVIRQSCGSAESGTFN